VLLEEGAQQFNLSISIERCSEIPKNGPRFVPDFAQIPANGILTPSFQFNASGGHFEGVL